MQSPSPLDATYRIASRYRVRRKLGSGRRGTVFLVDDEARGHPVALKILRPTRDTDGLQSLQSEFRALCSLRHPQLATAYDFGYTESGQPFYTREYVEGVTLRAGPPPGGVGAAEYLRPTLELLDALHYLHTQGVLHLDVHAGNVLEASDPKRGTVLIDFGVSLPPPTPLTSSSLDDHTVLAPELFSADEAGPPADVFAAGRLLLFRLTGQASEPQLSRDIAEWGTRRTTSIERIVEKALRQTPTERFPSALEFREALLHAIGEREETSSSIQPGETLVGREREVAILREALVRAPRGRETVLALHGPTGVGKTRLLTEARTRAQLAGLDTLFVHFVESGQTPSIRETALKQFRGRDEILNWLSPLPPDRGGSTRDRAKLAAESYFTSDGPPLAILIDDCELGDHESRELVAALTELPQRRDTEAGAHRGMLLVVASTDALALPATSRRDERVHQRTLRPLSQKQSIELLSTWVRPLQLQRKTSRAYVSHVGGTPLCLRRLAISLHAEFGSSDQIPTQPRLDLADSAALRAPHAVSSLGSREGRILRLLCLCERPVDSEELAAVSSLSRTQCERTLRHLKELEFVRVDKQRRRRRYQPSDKELASQVRAETPRQEHRSLHEKLLSIVNRRGSKAVESMEHRVHHLLGSGQRAVARDEVIRASSALQERKMYDRALRLLRLALNEERVRHWRIRFSEEMSLLYEQTGDHDLGVQTLAPVCAELGSKTDRSGQRLLRRLGVHYHRAGDSEEALGVFRRLRHARRPCVADEELIAIEAEVASLQAVRGELKEAENACHRGLTLLNKLDASSATSREACAPEPSSTEMARSANAVPTEVYRAEMEILLRASLGHLELRRLHLQAARRELTRALCLAERFGTSNRRAAILNNLGIAYNHSNAFSRAVRCYQRAGKEMQQLGDRRGMLHVACNLATITSKRGKYDEAKRYLAQANELLRQCRGKRLEFVVASATGMVAHSAGETETAIRSIRRAIELGAEIGDVQYVLQLRIYLVEALVYSARYTEAGTLLRRTRRTLAEGGSRSTTPGPTLYLRQLDARDALLQALLGRTEKTRALLRRLRLDLEAAAPGENDSEDRTHDRRAETSREESGTLLETWNLLYVGCARYLIGDGGDAETTVALQQFQDTGLDSGIQLSRIARLFGALNRERTEVRRRLHEVAQARNESAHRLVRVLQPLARAFAHSALEEWDAARALAGEASSAIVGCPFLEPDWQIEFVRARCEIKARNFDTARRHYHRAAAMRDFISRGVPARSRTGYLEHRRQRTLDRLAADLQRAPKHRPPSDVRAATRVLRDLVGNSSQIQRLRERIVQFANAPLPVLVVGESGTGKDLAAQLVHRVSSRNAKVYYTLDAASLPPELLESELFGYEAGAFSGADESRPGLLEHLSGGTLYLDRVESLHPTAQGKLLAVFDGKPARRLGSLESRSIDVRFVLSAGPDLHERLARGEFLRDLFQRCSAFTIEVPPLRQRREDIPELAHHFLARHADRFGRPSPTLSAEALSKLESHDWPGNVRELETTIVRALFTASGVVTRDHIDAALPPERRRSLFPPDLLAGRPLEELKQELERAYLLHVFADTRGDISEMAKRLGVKRSNIYGWLSRVGLDIRELRRSRQERL